MFYLYKITLISAQRVLSDQFIYIFLVLSSTFTAQRCSQQRNLEPGKVILNMENAV